MSTSELTVREPARTVAFWESYTDIGHNDSKKKGGEHFDWLWIYVDGHLIAKEREIGYTHSKMQLPGGASYYNCYRGSYDVAKKAISLAKPDGREILSFKEIPSSILLALRHEFPEAEELIDFGV
jgi:hypothetical protein